MVSLPDLAQRLNELNLLTKAFNDCTKTEIMMICEAVMSSIGDDVPPEGWDKPRIEDGKMILSFKVHPKYRWWTPEGQSITETLVELNADYAIASKYIQNLTEEEWFKKNIPF